MCITERDVYSGWGVTVLVGNGVGQSLWVNSTFSCVNWVLARKWWVLISILISISGHELMRVSVVGYAGSHEGFSGLDSVGLWKNNPCAIVGRIRRETFIMQHWHWAVLILVYLRRTIIFTFTTVHCSLPKPIRWKAGERCLLVDFKNSVLKKSFCLHQKKRHTEAIIHLRHPKNFEQFIKRTEKSRNSFFSILCK